MDIGHWSQQTDHCPGTFIPSKNTIQYAHDRKVTALENNHSWMHGAAHPAPEPAAADPTVSLCWHSQMVQHSVVPASLREQTLHFVDFASHGRWRQFLKKPASVLTFHMSAMFVQYPRYQCLPRRKVKNNVYKSAWRSMAPCITPHFQYQHSGNTYIAFRCINATQYQYFLVGWNIHYTYM